MKIEHYLYRIQQIHKELIKHSNHCESILSHYNDKAEGLCTLNEIIVTPTKGCNTKRPDESKCSSYEYEEQIGTH